MYIKSRLFFVNFILYILAVLVLLFALLISPLYLVRWQKMVSGRIGHFAANIELYCCERDSGINIPKQRYIDLFYTDKEVCNNQLKTMWKREITIVPYLFGRILSKSEKLIFYLESIFPIIKSHIIGIKTSEDRDIYNLLEKFTKHLEFTPYEENIGRQQLKDAGIPANAKFVCLISRDDAYLNSLSGGYDWSHHDFRNADIQTFVMAAEELAEMGYYVFRMGSVVNEPIRTEHPRVIDYATSAMRNDFMDIYLGAKCYFCISVSTGYDAIPQIFRRPIVFVNMVPIGMMPTWSSRDLLLTKHHYSIHDNHELSLKEIINRKVTLCYSVKCYSENMVRLVDNTPEEIRDQVIEMVERLEKTWVPSSTDKALQKRFWSVYQKNDTGATGMPLHGRINALFGAKFLRNNPTWLE